MLIRKTALEILIRIEKGNSFSHLLISDTLDKIELNIQDGNLLVEIVYGTIERKLTLNYFLSPFISKNKKMDDWVLTLLQMSVYQMRFLDKIPDYAIINEAVEIAKNKGHKRTGSLVNGVLRSIQSHGVTDIDLIEDKVEHLSIKTSHPQWLVELWISNYGYDITKRICERNLTRKPMTIRSQVLKNSRSEFIDQLANFDIVATKSPVTKQGGVIEKGNVMKTPRIGMVHATAEDKSSMIESDVFN